MDGLQAIPFSSSSDDAILKSAFDPISEDLYVVGYVQSEQALGTSDPSYNSSTDGFLAKFSSSGTLLWHVYVSSAMPDAVTGLTVLENGDVVITGYISEGGLFGQTSGSSINENFGSSYSHQAFVASYSPNGLINWINTYGGEANDIGLDLVSIGNDAYTVIGFDNAYSDISLLGHSPAPIVSSFFTKKGLGATTSYALLKHDESGNLAWKAFYGSDRDDLDLSDGQFYRPENWDNTSMSVEVDQVYIASIYSRALSVYDSDNTRLTSGTNGSNVDLDILFMRFSTDGSSDWQTSIWIGGEKDASHLALTTDCNGLYLGATMDGSSSIYPNQANPYQTGTGYDAMVFKANLDDGVIQWHREFVSSANNSDDERITSLVTDQRGNLFFLGSFKNIINFNQDLPPATHVSLSPISGSDILFGAMNTHDGEVRYAKALGQSGDDYGNDVTLLEDRLLLVGSGEGGDEFDFTAGPSGTNNQNLAIGMSSNNMTSLSEGCCFPDPIPGNISASSSGPYCPGDVVRLTLAGNNSSSTWLSNYAGTIDTLATGSTVLDYTVSNAADVYVIVENECGVISSSNQISISLNTQVPSAECVTNVPVFSLDDDGNTYINVSDIDNGSSAVCGIDMMSISPSSFNCNQVGFQTVYLTVVGNNGETNSCSSAVEISDITAPTISCPGDYIATIPEGQCSVQLTTAQLSPTITENCSETYSFSTAGATSSSGNGPEIVDLEFLPGSTNVTYTATDGVNSSTCSFNVTAQEPEIIISTQDISVDEDDAELKFIVSAGFDVCEDIVIEYSLSNSTAVLSQDYSNPTSLQVTIPSGDSSVEISIPIIDDALYEYSEEFILNLTTSSTGSIITPQAIGTIVDNDSAPSLEFTNYSVNESAANVALVFNLSEVSGLDASFEIVTTDITTNLADYEEISTPYLVTITAGQTSVTTNLAISDDVIPESTEEFKVVMSNPTNLTLPVGNQLIVSITDNDVPLSIQADNDFASECSIDYSQVGYSTSGGCAPISVSVDSSWTAACGTTGTMLYFYTAIDDCGVTVMDTLRVDVMDTTAPVIITSLADMTLNCDEGLPSQNIAISDNCDNTPTWTVTESFAAACGSTGTYTRTYTATDLCDNTSTATQVITIEDNTAPTLTLEAVINIDCATTIPLASATVNDNCDTDPILSVQETFEAACGNTGTYRRTYLATDVCGNTSAVYDQTIHITDTTAPSLVLEPDLVLECGTSSPIASAEVSDACNTAMWTVATETTAGCGSSYTAVRTYTATDECGNSIEASQNIEFRDTSAPSFAIATDTLVSCSTPYDVVSYADIIDCSATLDMQIDTSYVAASEGLGHYEITYTLIDDCGNDSVQVQTINLYDSHAPIVAGQNYNVPLDSNGLAIINTAMIDNGTTDACSSFDMSLSEDTFDAVGDYPVWLIATDYYGNVDSTEVTVTVSDEILPTALCQDVTIYLDALGQAEVLASAIDNGSWDNSGNIWLSLSQNSYDCAAVGTQNIDTLYVSDGSLTSSCTATVFVLDTLSPNISCTDTLFYNEPDAGLGSAYLSLPFPDYGDNCTGASLTNSYTLTDNASGEYAFGYTPITWTVTNNDQSVSCITVIELTEYIDPTINCLDTIQAYTSADDCGVAILVPEADIINITDLSCSLGDYSSAIYFEQGETDIIWTSAEHALSCTTVLLVTDSIAPQIDCLSDTVHCGLSLELTPALFSDNCSPDLSYSINGISQAPMDFEHGIATDVIWTVSDGQQERHCTTKVTCYDISIGAIAGTDQELNAVYETQLEATSPSYGQGYWTLIEGLGNLTDDMDINATLSGLQTGVSTLSWTVETEHCGTSSDTMMIAIRDFLVPTGFSPNADGYNDVYRIVGISTVPNNSLAVYNRWGNKVYSAKSYANDWDGHGPSGAPLPPDTYYFILELGESRAPIKGSMEIRY